MGIRVFIADDHNVVREGLGHILQTTSDIEVAGSAADGLEAFRRVRQLRPDVSILDIAMPNLNGIAAAARIREHDPDARIIMLSMHASSEHVYRALQAGARGYLLKDAVGDELIAAVRTVHRGKRYFSPAILDFIVNDYTSAQGDPKGVSPMESLSAREREIMQLVAEGHSSARIGEMLHLSPKTVESYRSRMMQKLGIRDLTSLVKFAIRHGLTTLE